ncbi:tryptophan--tRNA ligase [Sphingopyxis alaskensis]|jgi:tryptophanyl-tRNA synthetase|uniref:Tryptophan--tRNA ligase n=1 Tax=Sphingopyxis alaskensis (strain DSM 13593 / LMG 18877 / RB2256) TaxID=317655 RepID=Q1GRJ8_SPHAL|nr:tryptophan--tRNA ligase [Sphingopyxis alaskensis]ABF53724.1 tryptophanyl-tRNA synthetase [Sphingopyxis alaskensis RB2256]MCM3419400.1 tryptophan--tRNA ligase [Sphingopyxis alaskensis]
MRTLSGIQPTGNLHLGNYLGAIRNWVRMQDAMEGEKLYFLADLHAITVHNDPAELTANTREMAAALMAAGIDPAKAILFNQARVPAHAELAWLLFCTARIGWLNRMTQFKEKSGKNREGASVGLFAYPVLQAADVLLYQTTHVPVGDDQKQHLELARDIATKFNLDTGTDTFTLPEPTIPATAARIMSLRDGNAKMSKSDPSDMSRINLVDDPDTIMAKIRKAKTDPEPLPSEAAGLEGRPEAKNLVSIYAAMADESVDQVLARFAGQGFGAFKPALGELLVETLRPIAARLTELKANPAAIDAALEAGAARASALAKPTLDAAYAALGLCR